MIERLCIPAWNAPPRTLADWRDQLQGRGLAPRIVREPDATWLVVEPLGLRGLAVLEGANLSALHVEIEAADPAPALALLEESAAALGWEVHDDEDDPDDEDD